MKLNKKLEAEILKVYNAYWDSYFNGDMQAFASLLHENVQLIGSSENEVFNNKRSAMKFYKATAGQVAGKAGVRNRKITMQLVGNSVLVIEQSDFYVLIDNEWSFYGNGRISTLLQKTDKGWKIIHEHGSLPDSKAGEGEQVNTERIKAENRQLREAVKRRTIELEVKNRELEIETALERVRVVATGMRNPEDMLDVCKTISLQLESLGIKEIRNVQTAIFYQERGSYMNYEYYAKHKKTFITETIYTNNKLHKAFALKMLKGKGESFITQIKGKKVKEWIAYQKTTNVFIDKYLNKASSLNYYWFSLGPVALGISTYHPLTEEEIDLFKRFLKVFELAYRRYLDIEKAEAQAREVNIQLALERVRARTMAMQKSEELAETAQVLFQQFSELGENPDQLSIGIVNESEKVLEIWLSVQGTQMNRMFKVSVNEPIVINKIYKAWKKQKKTLVIDISGNDLKKYNDFRNNLDEYKDYNVVKYNFSSEENRRVIYCAFFPKGLLSLATPEPGPDETLKLLERFAGVFDLTYTRFLDLKKAEAQAREAQIEASLEKVRSSAMAMHKSNDISLTTTVIFEELKKLSIKSKRCGIGLLTKDSKTAEVYAAATSSDGKFHTLMRTIDMTQHESLRHQYDNWIKQENYETILKGEELRSYYKLPFFQSSANYVPTNHFEQSEYGYYIPFSKGLFYAWSENPYQRKRDKYS